MRLLEFRQLSVRVRQEHLQCLAVEAAVQDASDVGLVLGATVRLKLQLDGRDRILHDLAKHRTADPQQYLHHTARRRNELQ